MKFILLITTLTLNLLLLNAQNLKVVKFNEVEKIIQSTSDTIYVINFWATWCKPCMGELPYFEALTQKYKDRKFKVILISMDFKSDLKKRLKPFLEERKLNSEVWYLDETKQNEFMPKVEENWSGAIPFTLIMRGSDTTRFWKEGKWSEEELNKKIEELL